MDDLDHSMCLAVDEWVRFHEECEECALPRPAPASPDNWGLSDLEDSDSAAGHQGQRPPAKGDKVEAGASRRPVGADHSLPGGSDDLLPAADGGSQRLELGLGDSATGAARPAEHAAAAASPPAEDTGKAEGSRASSVVDPLSGPIQGAEEPTGNGPRGDDGALRAEKERWFVTLNDGPRQRGRGPSLKKKRRPKQPRSGRRLPLTGGWEEPEENASGKIEKANLRANPDLLTPGHPLTSGRCDGGVDEPGWPASGLLDVRGDAGLPGPDEPMDRESDLPATEPSQEPPEGADTRAGAPPSSRDGPARRATPTLAKGEGPGRAQTPPPSVDAKETPGEGSERDGETAAFAPGPRTRKLNLSPPTGGLSGGPAPTPVFTPRSLADNPETRAAAAGHIPPAYAISAFWHDVEKATINDILQLRGALGAPAGPADKSPRPRPSDGKSADGAPLDSSDYSTQLDESRPDRSGCDLSASDLEEEPLRGASRNSSPDRPGASRSLYLAEEEGECTASEGMETPVPAGHFTPTCSEDQDRLDLRSNSSARTRGLTKCKSMRTLGLEDLWLRGEDEGRPAVCSPPDETSSGIPVRSNEDSLDNHTQTFSPEGFHSVTEDGEGQGDSGSVLLYDPDPAPDNGLLTFRDDVLFTFLQYSQCSQKETIPIFSYSHPIIRTLTFPSYVFLNPACRLRHFAPPPGVVPALPGEGGTAVPGGLRHGNGFEGTKRSASPKAGTWRRSSWAWMLPLDTADPGRAGPPADVGGAARPPRREGSPEQQMWEAIGVTGQGGLVSRLRQSDMCLVCIAVASWVLRSADPEAADTWKAALLANISALSAIRYLRQYVAQNSSPDGP